MVIGLSGEQFGEAVVGDSGSYLTSGLFRYTATNLYNEGYDSYYFNEDVVDSNQMSTVAGSGPLFDLIRESVNSRLVSHLTIYGHSHGGGSTYDLAAYFNQQKTQFTHNFQLDMTAYIDAIGQNSILAETRYPPPKTQYHVNYYEPGSWLHGRPVNGATNINVDNVGWLDPTDGSLLRHGSIDDSPDLNADLQSKIETHTMR